MAFIVLEGGEGAGKTTQITFLKERLPALYPGKEFVYTREPGGTEFASAVRALVLSDAAKTASGAAMLGLFIAARFDHIEKVVAPALREGKVVICDRFTASTFAYQIWAADAPELTPLFEACLTLWPRPDREVILDIDPRVAQARLQARTGQERTHFDARELSYHERLREGYREYRARYAATSAVWVDAAREKEAVCADVLRALKPVLG